MRSTKICNQKEKCLSWVPWRSQTVFSGGACALTCFLEDCAISRCDIYFRIEIKRTWFIRKWTYQKFFFYHVEIKSYYCLSGNAVGYLKKTVVCVPSVYVCTDSDTQRLAGTVGMTLSFNFIVTFLSILPEEMIQNIGEAQGHFLVSYFKQWKIRNNWKDSWKRLSLVNFPTSLQVEILYI